MFGSFSKLDAPAHRIVIIIAVIFDHKDFIIFDDDCPNTDIDNTFTAADAYIFVHVFPIPLPVAGDGSVGALMYILSSLCFFFLPVFDNVGNKESDHDADKITDQVINIEASAKCHLQQF